MSQAEKVVQALLVIHRYRRENMPGNDAGFNLASRMKITVMLRYKFIMLGEFPQYFHHVRERFRDRPKHA